MLRVLLTGGGTGGHIYPALAVARRLKAVTDQVEILYVGTERGLESQIVPEAGLPFKAVHIEGFKRQLNKDGILHNLKTLKLLHSSYQKSLEIIKEFEPNIVLGTGGYVAGPVCLAASRQGVPTMIHEQNSVLGLTNKILLKFVDKIAISFPDIYEQIGSERDKIVFTGNPRGQEIAQMTLSDENFLKLGLNPELPTVLVVGGSRGAEAINGAVLDIAPQLVNAPYQTIFVTGSVHYDLIQENLKDFPEIQSAKNFLVVPYLPEMIDILSHSDLIVSRSGATTIAEITALGKASILIPSPYVTDNHQEKNAKSLVDHGAAILMKEQTLSGDLLYQTIDQLMADQGQRLLMEKAAEGLGHPQATDDLIQVMLDLVKQD